MFTASDGQGQDYTGLRTDGTGTLLITVSYTCLNPLPFSLLSCLIQDVPCAVVPIQKSIIYNICSFI